MRHGRLNREPERLAIVVSAAPSQVDGGEFFAGERTPCYGPELVVAVRGKNREDENVENRVRVRRSRTLDEVVINAVEMFRRKNMRVGEREKHVIGEEDAIEHVEGGNW